MVPTLQDVQMTRVISKKTIGLTKLVDLLFFEGGAAALANSWPCSGIINFSALLKLVIPRPGESP